MTDELRIYLDLAGTPIVVGHLWARRISGRESASFQYDAGWLTHPRRFELDPLLPLAPGIAHTPEGCKLFGAFTDPAPDRWGRNLMLRRERRRAAAESRPPRTLGEIDFLIGVDDRTRLGALRFQAIGSGDFLTTASHPIPPIARLPRLLAAAAHVEAGEDTDEDMEILYAPGTSLGGARPKATAIDGDGGLLVAKFPKRDDDWPVIPWEATALALARQAGVSVPETRLVTAARQPVLLSRRFDRQGEWRIPFMSAMTALGARDGDQGRSYLEIVDALRRSGAAVAEDARQLWRRIVFNILVSNTDDHLRNHGFLRARGGWRLSPAYDLNPVPTDVRERMQALTIDEVDPTSSLDLAFSVVDYFGLKPDDAREIAAEVGSAVGHWRKEAGRHGLSKNDIERMASAFEHGDLRQATAMRVGATVAADGRGGRRAKPKSKKV